jgi:ABC-type branched-subunit amino acid transport system permease subunit
MSVPAGVLILGVILGLTYGLLALGLVIIYKTSRVLNFAHGELGVLSAVVLQKLVVDDHFPYWPTLAAVLALAVAIGAGCELLLRRFFTRPRLLMMVATIGLAQVLYVLTLLGFLQTKHAAARFPVPFSLKAHVGAVVLRSSDLLTLILAPAAAIGLALFFSMSPYGLAMRAAAENVESARLGGIWVKRTSTLAWMMAGLLSGITAILVAPTRPPLGFAQALGPSLLVRALVAALLGAMVDLRVAFVAGVGVGVIEEVLTYNHPTAVEPAMFGLLLLALIVRARTLRLSTRTEERSSWHLGVATRLARLSPDRVVVGRAGTAAALGAAVLLPMVAGNSRLFLCSLILVYAVIAVSITVLTGWAGQLSLGQFGLVAVGALLTARWEHHLALPLLFGAAGLVTAGLAIVVGLPALRLRGLYLAVTTLGFSVVVSGWLLSESHLGLPDPFSTRIVRPSILGLQLTSERANYLLCLAVLVLVLLACSNLRRSGVARAFIAVRDNEAGAAALGLRVVITKLAAFSVAGFIAGLAGVLYALTQQRIGIDKFDPFQSILVVAMVVIGGMGSIRGSVLGAVYLLGIPALLGTTSSTALQQTAGFLTGGLGLLVFLLYLPGGLVSLLDRVGDAIAAALARSRAPAGVVAAPEAAT